MARKKKSTNNDQFPNWVVLLMFVLVIIASVAGIVLFSGVA